ncbi:MAG: hypothetical protein GOVbin4162_93 [Prokaryotic dsDNA virus sp.]|nr:MAG: hypothetical protein GOVbin4162_93 [Prokaryotic dsDNA virus sp.]
MQIKDLDDNSYEVDLSQQVAMIESSNHYPHWVYWGLWVILFYPACIILLIMGLNRKKYSIVFTTPSGTRLNTWVNEATFARIVNSTEISMQGTL